MLTEGVGSQELLTGKSFTSVYNRPTPPPGPMNPSGPRPGLPGQPTSLNPPNHTPQLLIPIQAPRKIEENGGNRITPPRTDAPVPLQPRPLTRPAPSPMTSPQVPVKRAPLALPVNPQTPRPPVKTTTAVPLSGNTSVAHVSSTVTQTSGLPSAPTVGTLTPSTTSMGTVAPPVGNPILPPGIPMVTPSNGVATTGNGATVNVATATTAVTNGPKPR